MLECVNSLVCLSFWVLMLRAACLAGYCRVAGLCLLMFFLVSFASISVLSESVAVAYSIGLGEFRWNRFPLRVLLT